MLQIKEGEDSKKKQNKDTERKECGGSSGDSGGRGIAWVDERVWWICTSLDEAGGYDKDDIAYYASWQLVQGKGMKSKATEMI